MRSPTSDRLLVEWFSLDPIPSDYTKIFTHKNLDLIAEVLRCINIYGGMPERMKENLARALEAVETHSTSSIEAAYEILSACNDAKGKDVTVLDVSKVFDLSDYFIIATGRSDRQVQGIANRIIESMRQRGQEPVVIEGMEKGHWVLIDFGDVVAHVFYEPLRDQYDIEGLWMRGTRVNFKKSRNRIAPVAA